MTATRYRHRAGEVRVGEEAEVGVEMEAEVEGVRGMGVGVGRAGEEVVGFATGIPPTRYTEQTTR